MTRVIWSNKWPRLRAKFVVFLLGIDFLIAVKALDHIILLIQRLGYQALEQDYARSAIGLMGGLDHAGPPTLDLMIFGQCFFVAMFMVGIWLGIRGAPEAFYLYGLFYALYKLVASLKAMGLIIGGATSLSASFGWDVFGFVAIAVCLFRASRDLASERELAKEQKFVQEAKTSLTSIKDGVSRICPQCKNKSVGQAWCFYCGHEFGNEKAI